MCSKSKAQPGGGRTREGFQEEVSRAQGRRGPEGQDESGWALGRSREPVWLEWEAHRDASHEEQEGVRLCVGTAKSSLQPAAQRARAGTQDWFSAQSRGPGLQKGALSGGQRQIFLSVSIPAPTPRLTSFQKPRRSSSHHSAHLDTIP